MQIKLVILTICASLAAVGFAAPPPPGGPNFLDALIPGGDPPSGTNDPSLPLPDANDSGITSTEGKPPQSLAGQVQKRKAPFIFLRKGRGRRPVQKPPAPAPTPLISGVAPPVVAPSAAAS
ncbi:hypothetical protein BCV72DRAFT_339559 [Rhizopus microsporus var. microsporus]|uniref:Uncharacterized protein n=1 Tax=Rhizopus microsporus var. microsporus TaxID=86635 RepID=A0A1X0QNB9_RHIZD|nr:hypothetical protein BCV72DRAFT_339559 [Rhizopus microsporus var. microsporus]